jgi:serine/threonine protein kinase
MGLSAGTRLGPYEIVSPLGAGGMGEVYKAFDTRARSHGCRQGPFFRAFRKARFETEREAKTISALQHSHICVLFDVGRDPASGADYLVMEYLEGESLADRLRKGALPVAEQLEIAGEIADALSAAHAAGITHRDLKPANVMLTKSGGKLLDFGLATPLNGTASSSPASSVPSFTVAKTLSSASPLSPLTSPGSIVGTIQYMSPEQIEGKEADARSDIFAFGATLYEMCTGKRPFEGKSQIKIASAILEDQPVGLRVLQPKAPHELERLVNRCLNKDPQSRFQCAHDLKLELNWLRESRNGATGQKATEQTRSLFRERMAGEQRLLSQSRWDSPGCSSTDRLSLAK